MGSTGGAADEGDEEADRITDGLGGGAGFECVEGSVQQPCIVGGGEPTSGGLAKLMEFGATELVEGVVKLGGEGFVRFVVERLLIVIRR